MKILLKYFWVVILPTFILAGCDKIDNPYQNAQTVDVPKDSVFRKILIEDFTGHTCGNCPTATIKAIQLQNLYGKKVIVVGVHSGFFARPRLSGKFTTDFRTPAGEEYNSFWKVDVRGNPNGFVSRSGRINNDIIINPDSWGEAIELLKNLEPEVKLSLSLTYDGSSRALSANVNATALKNISGKYNLVLYLVEDNIVDWQKDYSMPTGAEDNPEFLHRHVLRDNINGTWGEELISPSLSAGDSLSKSYSNYLLKQNWKEDNCSVVAYIYNTENYEIIQAEEVYIKKK
jgi:thiol-disulfide isomerase/thioredoxin